VPASVTIAQAALESDWGKSKLSTQGQNYFGIKATKSPGTAGVVNMPTGEYLNGSYVTVNAPFKAYNNMADSFTDHGVFLKDNPRYAKLFTTNDPDTFARGLQSAGYATDPSYAAKLIKFMDTFNLYQYDVA
jgi:flagellum-specific peptidoglycan hydrolase FlgJ